MAQTLLVVDLDHPCVIACAPAGCIEANRVIGAAASSPELNETGRQQHACQPAVFQHLSHEATQVSTGRVGQQLHDTHVDRRPAPTKQKIFEKDGKALRHLPVQRAECCARRRHPERSPLRKAERVRLLDDQRLGGARRADHDQVVEGLECRDEGIDQRFV